MRHSKSGRRLGRTTSHRIAMFRNMVTSFLTHEKIVTTDAKAKELRPIAEKMITLGKQGDLHAVRQAAAYIRDKQTVTKLFSVIAPRFKERPGGYTRIVKLGIRPGDTAEMSLIELVEEEMKAKDVKKTRKSATRMAAPAAAETPVETAASVDAPVADGTESGESSDAKDTE
jgi:large subunit ribosomal protein L17